MLVSCGSLGGVLLRGRLFSFLDQLNVLEDEAGALHGFFAEGARLRGLVKPVKETIENLGARHRELSFDLCELCEARGELFLALDPSLGHLLAHVC